MRCRFRFIWVCFLALILSAPLHAQILNADEFGNEIDSTQHFFGDVAVGFSIDKKTETIYSLGADADLAYRFARNLAILAGAFEVLQTRDERLLNGGFVHHRYRFLYNKVVSPEIFGQYQYDNVRGLKERFLAGAGPRFRLQKDSLGSLYLGTGLMYEYEQWNHTAVDDELGIPDDREVINRFIKFTSYLSFTRQLGSKIALNTIIYYQARPDSYYDEPRLAGDAELKLKLTELLALSIVYNIIYDSNPPVPIEKVYYSLENKLSFQF